MCDHGTTLRASDLHNAQEAILNPFNSDFNSDTIPEINKRVSKMRPPLAGRREPAGDRNRQPMVLYVFEHKK